MQPAGPAGRRITVKTILALALAALLPLAACGTDPGSAAQDSGLMPDDNPVPIELPVADGPVRTRGLATVMDTGIDTGRPELCLGAVAESYPPQCGGPEITNWGWGQHDGTFEREGDVRWGEFALTGTFDGTAFRVTDAIPAALYDAAAPQPDPTPAPAASYSAGQLANLAERLGSRLPGALTSYAEGGHVLVDVTYDDGSLQAWADEAYGANVVVVTSALVDVTGR